MVTSQEKKEHFQNYRLRKVSHQTINKISVPTKENHKGRDNKILGGVVFIPVLG